MGVVIFYVKHFLTILHVYRGSIVAFRNSIYMYEARPKERFLNWE